MLTNDSILKRIKEIMESKRITPTMISERTGILPGTLSRYLNGKANLPLKLISPLAHALGVKPSHLLGLDENTIGETVSIPMLGEIACGTPLFADSNVIEYVTLSSDMLSDKKEEYFFLQAHGNSMSPTIKNGAKVLIHSQSTVDEGEIAAVLLLDSNEATLKRVRKSGNSVILMPDNLDFSPIVVSQDTRIRILGKAVQVITEL